MPDRIETSADFDRWCDSLRWPQCPNDHPDPAAWIEGRDATISSVIRAIGEIETPMPLDTLIKVGMLADVESHGEGIPIEGISVTLCPRRDPAAEMSGKDGWIRDEVTAVEIGQIEAALLPYAVFDFGGHWCYGRQVRRVYEKGAKHEG